MRKPVSFLLRVMGVGRTAYRNHAGGSADLMSYAGVHRNVRREPQDPAGWLFDH